MNTETSIESAIDRLTDAIDDHAGVLRDIRATLEDILDAVFEANEERRAANGETPTEDDESDADEEVGMAHPLDRPCECEECSTHYADDHRAGWCKSDCEYCWVNSGNRIPCRCNDPKGCAICIGGRFTPLERRPVQPPEGKHSIRRICPCKGCSRFRAKFAPPQEGR
jgi:hypothetical protein